MSKAIQVSAAERLVESVTIGAIVAVRTSRRVVLVHVRMIPLVDDHTAKRIRDWYEVGDLTIDELAIEVGLDNRWVSDVICGVRAFKHFPNISRDPRCNPRLKKKRVPAHRRTSRASAWLLEAPR